MTDIVEEVIHEVEAEFKPKPGGLVDTFRKDKARREEANRERENADERVEENSYRAIKTTQISPDGFSVNVVNIPAGGNAMLLPNSPYRYRAVVAVITAAQTIIIAKDAGAALQGVGFPLIQGNNPLPLFGRGQLWASAVNATQVAVISELYAPEA
jgi:hypothetical protein